MRRRVVIALMILGACLAPALARAATVAQVLIEGNARVDDEAIRIHVQSRPGARYDPATVDSDVRAIYAMGFFENVEVERRPAPEGMVLVFRVRERPLVTDVKIQGNKKVRSEDLEAALKVRPHTILDGEKLRRGVADAKKLYEEKGYLDATITPRVDPVPDRPHEVTITYVVDEGKIV